MDDDETTHPKGWMRQTWDWLAGLLSMLGRWLIAQFRALWQWLLDLARVLWPCRVGLAVLVLAAVALVALPQGREVTLGLDQAGPLRQTVFFAALVFWGFAGWLWTRLMLQAVFSIDRRHTRRGHELSPRLQAMIDIVPRLIGIGSALTASAAFVIHWGGSQGNTYGFLALLSLALSAGAYVFFRARGHVVTGREPAGWLSRRLRQLAQRPLFTPRCVDQKFCYRYFRELPPFFANVIYVSLVLAAVWLVLAGAKPAWTGHLFGAAAVAFIGFAFIVTVGGLFTFCSVRWGFPFDVVLLIAAFVFSFWVDNHDVRTTKVADGAGPASRPTLDEALERWASQFPDEQWASKNPPPFIVVATAGGALRAAYWTTTVLGAITDRLPDFPRWLFAISGVSGGSLGAGTFVGLLETAGNAGWGTGKCQVRSDQPYRDRGRCLLEADYLAPVLASLLTFDLVQRYVPFRLLPDRAWAIEQGWERGWLSVGVKSADCNSPLAQPFLSFWPAGQAWRPALLLNGTLMENGKRVITSNIEIGARDFVDAYDAHDLVRGRTDEALDFTMASAIDNSTRFPYVEPAGTLRSRGVSVGHIVDGGYFENFGAETAAEILRAGKRFLDENGKPFRPIVILISSDPGLERRDLPWCAASVETRAEGERAGPRMVKGWSGANETLSPPLGLYAARTARGVLAASNLCRKTADLADKAGAHRAGFFHFRLCCAPHRAEPGLGWLLSKESFELIADQLDERDCGNDIELQALFNVLAPDRRAGAGGT